SVVGCFVVCNGDHRDLLSFPTRRSSDLGLDNSSPFLFVPTGVLFGYSVCGGVARRERFPPRRRSLVRRVLPISRAAMSAAGMGRSEEHTSELQSRENLVCRLLLEKKKKL